MHELGVGFGSFVSFFIRTFARVPNAQRGGNHSDFIDAVFLLRFNQHARRSGIEWKLGHLPAGFRQLIQVCFFSAVIFDQCPQITQDIKTVANTLRLRFVDKRKGRDCTEIKLQHP